MSQQPAACGTLPGYLRHRRNNEPICGDCSAARSSYDRNRYARHQPGQQTLPPRACPMCLVGACHRCTGRLVVLDVAGVGRDEACEHQHPAGAGPVAQVLATVPAADVLGGAR